MTAPNPSNGQPVNVLFVCLGNICRSPMAEGVFRNIAANHPLINNIDSAGTGAYHAGEPSDSRTMSTLRRHNIRNYHHLARKVTLEDFLNFDYLFAMDEYNLEDLLELRASILSSSSKSAGRAARGKGTRAATAASIAASVEAGAKVAEVRLFGDYGPGGTLHERVGGGEVVQDPYYGGANGFEEVYQQVVRFSTNFLQYLEKKNQN
ncbi:tyrosine protein phosphatase LTP1 [Aspergillus foveolatus]|uniref:tyrosine protein phosphatase LTP1 n=1 Tax=Aspergillus foveolatus TaxID=210207 RepID=UPI003CCCFC5A